MTDTPGSSPAHEGALIWQRTQAVLADCGYLLQHRTSTRPLREFAAAKRSMRTWAPRPRPGSSLQGGVMLNEAARLVRAGVGTGDIEEFTRLFGPPSGRTMARDSAAVLLSSFLLDVEALAPDLPLRDALGWMLTLAQQENTLPEHVPQKWAEWNDAGVPDGWAFHAAGLSAQEAAAGLADGSVSRAQAVVLAALRGTALPVQ